MNHTAPEGTNKNEIEVISYSTIQVYLNIALKRFLALLHSNRKKNNRFFTLDLASLFSLMSIVAGLAGFRAFFAM